MSWKAVTSFNLYLCFYSEHSHLSLPVELKEQRGKL